ncbi:MAG: hypothetical protein MJ009_07270 [Paludibacteraceae bacterium]|nr:hypothetical protein [Paludibacteraceae bacterium]
MTDANYQEFVKFLADTKDSRIFLNSDEDHALDVLVQIFQHSQTCVRIFAGNLCEHVGSQSDNIIALSEFIERGGEVRILLNDYKEDKAKESNLFKRIAYYESLGKKIMVKSTTIKPIRYSDPNKKEVHFTVGDNVSYRLETDIENRKAECSFNSPIFAKTLSDFFDSIYEKSTEINIKNLFGNDNI